MAGWQDGSEYAPKQAPTGFAAPRVDPLPTRTDPGPASSLATATIPPVPPVTFNPPAQRGPDLAALQPSAQVPRDPRQPFEAGHQSVDEPFDPTQPFATTSRGLPGAGWMSATGEPSAAFAEPAGVPDAFPPPSGAPTLPAMGSAPAANATRGWLDARVTPNPPGAWPTGATPVGPGAGAPRRSAPLPLQQAAERHVAQRALAEQDQSGRPAQQAGPPGPPSAPWAPTLQRPVAWPAPTGAPGAPTPAQWSAPATQWAPLPDTPLSLSYFGQLFTALGWPMLGCLAIGAFIEPLAPTLLVCAWLLSTQARVPQGWIRWVFRFVAAVVGVLTFLMTLTGSYTPYLDAQLWARWGCLLLLVALPVGTLIRARRSSRHPLR